MPSRGVSPATDYYVNRLLTELPTHTVGGIPIEIAPDGCSVVTHTGRSKDGVSSYYIPIDYPRLFGWRTYTEQFGHPFHRRNGDKPPLIIEHKQHKYLRIGRAK